MRIYATVILFFLCQAVMAQSDLQDGFIISLQGDTTSVQLEMRLNTSNYKSAKVKTDNEFREYFPNEILGFGYYDDRYFSSGVEEDVFVENLVSGKLSLYRYNFIYYLKKDGDENYYKLEKHDKEIMVNHKPFIQEDNKWKGLVKYLTMDCLGDKSSNLGFAERQLVTFVVKYNECGGATFNENKAKLSWIHISPGLVVGMANNQFHFETASSTYDYMDDKYSSLNPMFGFKLRLTSPRTIRNLGLEVELNYLKSETSSLKTKQYVDLLTIRQEVTIEYGLLSFPVSLWKGFQFKQGLLFIQGGIVVNKFIGYESKVVIENQYTSPPEIRTSEKPATPEYKGNVVGFGAIGYEKNLGKFDAGVSIRYQFFTDVHAKAINYRFTQLAGLIYIKFP